MVRPFVTEWSECVRRRGVRSIQQPRGLRCPFGTAQCSHCSHCSQRSPSASPIFHPVVALPVGAGLRACSPASPARGLGGLPGAASAACKSPSHLPAPRGPWWRGVAGRGRRARRRAASSPGGPGGPWRGSSPTPVGVSHGEASRVAATRSHRSP